MSTDRLETARFLSHLPVLLNGGVMVAPCCTLFAEQTASPELAEALRAIATSLESGATIADALPPHVAHFPPAAIALLRTGEHSGLLDLTADRAAVELLRSPDKRTLDSEIGLVLRTLGWSMTAGVPAEDALPLLVGLVEEPRAAAALAAAHAANEKESPTGHVLAPLIAGMPEFVAGMLADAARQDAEEGTAVRVAPLLDGLASGLEQGWLTIDRAARPLAQELRTVFHLFARFIGMGIPLEEAFPFIASAVGREDVREALLAVHQALENRGLVADGMAKHPAVFAPTAVALIRNAEEDGRSLPRVADALAEGIDRGLFVPRPAGGGTV